MSIIRARQPGLTRMFPHNGNTRFLIPRAGARPEPPVFSPPPGTVASGTNVTITSPQGLPIYFTVDGETPDMVFEYTGPISVVGASNFRAVCKAPGGLPSAVVSASYSLSTDPNFVRWEFNNTADGFVVNAPTVGTLNPTFWGLTTPANANSIMRTVVTSGQTGLIWQYLEFNFKQVSETSVNANSDVQWTNVNHGFSNTYRKQMSRSGQVDGGVYSVVYDMWTSTNPADWQGSDVLSFRWKATSDTGVTGGCTYELNWVEARKAGFP